MIDITVLIVDPSEVYQNICAQMVHRDGVISISANSIEDAFIVANQVDCQIIIIAMELKDGKGTELSKQLRGVAKFNNIPIVLLTSDENTLVQHEYLEAGITIGFSKKDIENLESYVGLLLNNTQKLYQLTGKVMLVEDSPTMATILTAMLENRGLNVITAPSVEEALKTFDNTIDLIVTDILLESSLTGLDLIKAIRTREDANEHLPIIAVSGSHDTSRKIEALRVGANDFVAKPVEEEEFINRVHNNLWSGKLYKKVLKQKQTLEIMAMTDPLTGLKNRRYFWDHGKNFMSLAKRKSLPITAVMLDIDFFKKINDEHGHQVGDDILKLVGRELNKSYRAEDIVARIGGEEFAILLFDCNLDDALIIGENIRVHIEAIKEPVPVTVSVGVACSSETVDNLDELLHQSDLALYEAKENGRNQVRPAKS